MSQGLTVNHTDCQRCFDRLIGVFALAAGLPLCAPWLPPFELVFAKPHSEAAAVAEAGFEFGPDAFGDLETLKLSANNIQDEAVNAISSSLKKLVSLDLSYNDLLEDGAFALARSKSLSRLSDLDLSYNLIGDDAAFAIMRSFDLERFELIMSASPDLVWEIVEATSGIRELVLDGRIVLNLKSFFSEFAKMVGAPIDPFGYGEDDQPYFGYNMFSFDDCLWGGFGLDGPCRITWTHADVSREALDSKALIAWCDGEINRLQGTEDEFNKDWCEGCVELKRKAESGWTMMDYLLDTIRSVKDRGGSKYEIILVDGAGQSR